MEREINWLKSLFGGNTSEKKERSYPMSSNNASMQAGSQIMGAIPPVASPMRDYDGPGMMPGPAASPRRKTITAKRKAKKSKGKITAKRSKVTTNVITPSSNVGNKVAMSTSMAPTKKFTTTLKPTTAPMAGAAAPKATGGTGIGGAWGSLTPSTKNALRVGGGAIAGFALAKLFSGDDTDIDNEITYKGPVYNRYYNR